MISTTLIHNGAGINLALSGNAAELAAHVNRLYNYGVVSNVPDFYKEGEDDSVTVQSDRGRLLRGHIAMASVALQADKARTAKLKGKPGTVFRFLAVMDAAKELGYMGVETALKTEANGDIFGTPKGYSDHLSDR